jgi:hypothetical protein
VDRARYESELARRRFLRVDPDNRLVAASLETEWNSKLRALSEAEQNYERQRQADQLKVSAVQREQVLALSTDFPQLWNDPSTPDRERKRMIRFLIEDITIRKGEQIQLDVRFRGGMSKTLMLPRTAELLREPQAKSGHDSRNGPPLGRLQLRRRGANSQRERVQNRRRLAIDINSGRLRSKSVRTEEPLRSPS